MLTLDNNVWIKSTVHRFNYIWLTNEKLTSSHVIYICYIRMGQKIVTVDVAEEKSAQY